MQSQSSHSFSSVQGARDVALDCSASARVYITYHKPSHIVSSHSSLIPIQVGSGSAIPGISCRDDQGANIAQLNDRYCELTALYWIWKSLETLELQVNSTCAATSADHLPTHIGLLHYRRFFNFAVPPATESRTKIGKSSFVQPDVWGVLNERSFTYDFQDRYGLNDQSINHLCDQFDIILPKPWSVRQAGFSSLREHYCQADSHYAADLDRCRTILAEMYPAMLASWDKLMAGDRAYFNNMFVMRRDLFSSLCGWMFPILAHIEPLIPIHQYGTQAKRVMGYLSERLLNLWLLEHRRHHPETSIAELDRVFVSDTTPKVWDPPLPTSAAEHNLVSVVIASDNNYVPHLAALILSICDNFTGKRDLDLLVLDGGITQENQRLLIRLVSGISGVQLSFIPMMDEFQDYFVHMHFSRTTFYRLVLEKLLPSRNKVIYVDCDTIVLGDLAELWDLDLGDKPLAAVPDLIMEHFCRAKVLSADFTGSLPAADYLSRYLGVASSPTCAYFQAGLLIMDLAKMRKLNLGQAMVHELTQARYWFLDQDVLNKYYASNYLPLPNSWNFVNCEAEIIDTLSEESRNRLRQSASQINLIHYAGYEAKPWINKHANLSCHYFYYLRQTFWYEQVLEALQPILSTPATSAEPLSIRFRRRLRSHWRMLPFRVRQLLNPIAYRMLREIRG